ncbi:hypothetical protein PMAYCL1PPCAC_05931, partial [Pristionchus mayeri]
RLQDTLEALRMAMGKRRRTAPQECPSTCIGCGSKASGYHYDAPACCPCKTFFRRAVMQEREHSECLKDGECERDQSLHPCRGCRLERCLDGGMNPLLILTIENPETNPVVRRYLRKREEDVEPSTSSDSPSSLEVAILPKRTTSPSVIECTIDRVIGALLYLEKAHDDLRGSPFHPDPSKFRLDLVISSKSLLSLSMEELQITSRHSGSPRKPRIPGTMKDWPLADLLFSVEYMKTFEFFHFLSPQDKIALCRHVAIMCSQLTYAFFSYERKSGVTVHHDGSMPYNGYISANLPHEREMHHMTIQLLRDLELDKKEYVLIKALIVCNPAIEGLSTSYKVKLEQEREKFTKSLMSYVLSRRGHQKGPTAFTSMMGLVEWLTYLMKRHKDWYVLRKAVTYVPGKENPESIIDDVLLN